ncbi:hypothetical protein [Acutalibacter caecimuris]|uniref:hypothetical protein n=1 Tax=Acutalibacter caecimuris TaxID=3093657 RepID=UPI002AC8E4BD|nr:hypothetical protein [Acutalibacter sp. M00118]
MQRDGIQHNNGVEFFVDDPKNIDAVTAEIRKIGLDWNCFQLTVDNTAYETVASPLTARLIIGVVAVSIGILALVLNMWIKQRIHETGILLSVSVGKVQIVAQYILETLMIFIIAVGLSYCTSRA